MGSSKALLEFIKS